MSDLRVEVLIEATPEQVWDEVRHIDRHTEWMHDAVEITFVSDQRSGIGTTFDTLTRVGPLKTMDRMEITEWVDGEVMGVRHTGAVTGTGRFTLTPEGSSTRFVWEEDLEFPWFFGGPIGEKIGSPILGAIWRRNINILKGIIETGERPSDDDPGLLAKVTAPVTGAIGSLREKLGR
ncbi:MAG: SRPBCC family protein [Actinomycetota bacterium]